MNSKLFSVEEIKDLYKNINFNSKNLMFLIVCCLVILIIPYLGSIFFEGLKYYLFLLFVSPIVFYFLIVLSKMSLKLVDGKEVEFSDFFIPLNLFLKVLLSFIILGLIVGIVLWLNIMWVLLNFAAMGFSGTTMFDIFLGKKEGEASLLGMLFIFFIVLLSLIFILYVSIKYIFAPFLIIDKQYNIISSFKKSAELTKGKKLKIFKCINIVSWLNFKNFFKIISSFLFLAIIFNFLLINQLFYPDSNPNFRKTMISVNSIYLILFILILIDGFISFAFVYRYLIDKSETNNF